MSRELLGDLCVVVKIVCLAFNILTLILIKRQGCSSIDMVLATIMSISDILFVLSKLGQFVYFTYIGSVAIYDDPVFSQIDGFTVCLFASTSFLAIGYLALLRFWAIVLRRPIRPTVWWSCFFFQESVLAVFLFCVAINSEFRITPFKRGYFPDAASYNLAPRGAILLLILWLVFSLVSVSLCYPLLVWVYMRSVQPLPVLGYYAQVLRSQVIKQKLWVVVRMSTMLLIYDIILFFPIFVMSKEFFSSAYRTEIEDGLFGISFLTLGIINPLTLILLHEDITNDLKSIIKNLCKFSCEK